MIDIREWRVGISKIGPADRSGTRHSSECRAHDGRGSIGRYRVGRMGKGVRNDVSRER